MNTELIKDLRDRTGAGMMDCKKALEANDNDIQKAIDWLREKGIAKAAKKADRIAAEGLATIVIDGNNATIIEVNCETDFVAKNEKFQTLTKTIANAINNVEVNTLEEALAIKVGEETVNEIIVNATASIGEKLSLRRFTKLIKKDTETFGDYIHMGGKIGVLIVTENTNEEVAKDVAMHTAAMRPRYVRREEVDASELERESAILKEQAINEGKPAEIAEKMVAGRINKFYKEICLEEQEFVKNSDVSVGKYVSNNGGKIVTMTRYEVGEGMEKRNDNFAEEVMNQINA